MALRNVDSLLIKDNQERMEGLTPGSTEPYKDPVDAHTEPQEVPVEETKPEQQDTEYQEPLPEAAKTENKPEAKEEIKEKITDRSENKDEYGNEIAPKRMYSEDEVQNMIRDRLSRGRFAQQQPQIQQQTQQAAQGFEHDPQSSDSWEVQLEQFIDKTLNKRLENERNQAQMQREQQIQADFESKFTSGMQKYRDFQDVVANKPITDSMMLATRGMNDPAAFLYAAAKHHAKELERISQIADPFQQGAEIGKLEERMKKVRAAPSAPKPISRVSSDMGVKQEVHKSIEQRINEHAKSKRR